MSIKLIIFDLDGVLVETRRLHFEALNAALAKHDYAISEEEQQLHYEGLPTRVKLDILSQRRGLPIALHEEIALDKQAETRRRLVSLQPSVALQTLFHELQLSGYDLAIASNAVPETVQLIVEKLGLPRVALYHNKSVARPKPAPDIYLKAMLDFGASPLETLVVEDSPVGRTAAFASGAKVLTVNAPEDLTMERFQVALDAAPGRYLAPDHNILIPMAGAGTRFEQAGYTFPKPLIDVRGKPMIQRVVENLAIDAHYIFVVQRWHEARYNVSALLRLIAPGCDIVLTDGLTEGATCSALLAEQYIDSTAPLLIANSDQLLDWNGTQFIPHTLNARVDGCIPIFRATHPKWSFVRLEGGRVVEVAEKRPISDKATCGLYWWKRGKDFVRCAKQMIAANRRVNGEFYIAPVYNEAIADGLNIGIHVVRGMHGLGTPEDLEAYLHGSP